MNNLNFEFGIIPIIISTVVRVTAGIILLVTIIPLMIKQAKVRNGLISLRLHLLIIGVCLFFLNSIGLFILALLPVVTPDKLKRVVDITTIFTPFLILIIVIMLYRIYHRSYNEKSKKIHVKIEREEKRLEKLN